MIGLDVAAGCVELRLGRGAQALIDGRWVDFDATLRNRYHAAHVLTSTSDLADGAFSRQMAVALQLIGNLEIDIVEVGYDRLGATSRP